MTNLEGRVIRRRRVVMPPSGVASDIGILVGLAERLGHAERFQYASPEDVFTELGRATRGAPADYSGISYARIDTERGVYWPCPSADHPGTPRLFLDRFATASGRAVFHPVRHAAPAEAPDRDYPLALTTGRVMAHYQTGAMTRRVAALSALAPGAVGELHPQTATRYGVVDGAICTVSTRRGVARITLKVTRDIRPDTLFLPFHFPGDQSANRLTIDALDPTSRMPEFKVCAARIAPGAVDGLSLDTPSAAVVRTPA